MGINATAALHHAGHDGIDLREVHLPSPTGHQVLVEVEASGLCRSQLRQIRNHRSGDPFLLGHEGVGVVSETGPEVRGLVPGDRVVITWIPQAGDGVRAPEWATVDLGNDGTAKTVDGIFTWSTHALVDELYLVRLEPGDTDPALSLVGCAVITGLGSVVFAGECSFGENVVVIGAGGVGMAAIVGAACAGASKVLAVDVDDASLKLAEKLGATHTLNSTVEDLIATVRSTMGRAGTQGADLVIDCVGITATAAQALECARPAALGAGRGGRVVLVGVTDSPVTFEAAQFVIDQKAIIGALAGGMGHAEIRSTLAAIRAGKVDVAGMVTETAPFQSLPEALERLSLGRISGRALVAM